MWLIACLREVWPKTVITVRGDRHFCSHKLMDWAMLHDRLVFFVTGLARNSVLENHRNVYDKRIATEKAQLNSYDKYVSSMQKQQDISSRQQAIAKIKIPLEGAGKVQSGQRVNIRLDGYPYLEYGFLTGKVVS